MVTKQQQLEWLAKKFDVWPGFGGVPIRMSSVVTGEFNNGPCVAHHIRMEEWQQERDKIVGKPEVDNSWHERGEFPPAGCECECEADYDTEREEWYKARVIGVDSGECFLRWLDGRKDGYVSCYENQSSFRPLRTEREKAIEEIAALVRDGLVSHEMAKEFAVKMYDAGLKVVKR